VRPNDAVDQNNDGRQLLVAMPSRVIEQHALDISDLCEGATARLDRGFNVDEIRRFAIQEPVKLNLRSTHAHKRGDSAHRIRAARRTSGEIGVKSQHLTFHSLESADAVVDLLTETTSRMSAKASSFTLVKNRRPFAARQRSNVKLGQP